MELGINGTGLVQKADTQAVIEHARQAQSDGFSNYWIAEHPTGGFDALTVLTAVGSALPDLNVGTAIIPTMPDRKSTRLNSSHSQQSRMPSSA